MPKLPKIASLQYLRKEVSDDVDFGRNFQNIESLGGGGGGGVRRLEVAVEMGVVTLFITLQFNHTYCVCGKCKAPFITCRIFSIFS